MGWRRIVILPKIKMLPTTPRRVAQRDAITLMRLWTQYSVCPALTANSWYWTLLKTVRWRLFFILLLVSLVVGLFSVNLYALKLISVIACPVWGRFTNCVWGGSRYWMGGRWHRVLKIAFLFIWRLLVRFESNSKLSPTLKVSHVTFLNVFIRLWWIVNTARVSSLE